MDVVLYLQNELNAHRGKAREITDEADREARALSDTERTAVQGELKQMEEIQIKINSEREKENVRQLVDGFDRHAMGEDPNPVREPAEVTTRAKTLGDAFISSDVFKMLQAKYKEGGGLPEHTQSPPVLIPDWRFKAAGDPVLESDATSIFGTGGNAGAFTTLTPLQPPLQMPLTVADLIPSIPITVGNSASYPTVSTRTRASTTSVTEGAAKPGAEYVFTIVSEVLETKAAWVKVSTQFIEDAPGLAAYINADLPFMVRQTEESYLMSGLYTGAGLSANGADLDLAGTENAFDAIQQAIALIRLHGGVANGLVIDPYDWANLLTAKFGPTTGHTGYIGGGPFAATGNPWGLRTVVSDAATQGLPLVGDFTRAAKVYRRGGLTVRSTNTDQDDFIKNMMTILAEMRLALGISYTNLLCVAVIGTS